MTSKGYLRNQKRMEHQEQDHQILPLTQNQNQEPQQQQRQEQEETHDFCCICVQNERMHQNPCPGRQSAFQVPCGHQVHFLCLFAESTSNDFIGQCPICNVPFFPIEQIAWVVNYIDNNDREFDDEQPQRTFIGPLPRPQRKTIQDVWNSEPQFRKEVKTLRDIGLKFGKAKREFIKETSELRKKFANETKYMIDYLKDIKNKYRKQFTQIKARRSVIAYKTLYFRRQREILAKYQLDHYSSLKDLNTIPRTPHMKSRRQLYISHRYRMGYYAFRIRV